MNVKLAVVSKRKPSARGTSDGLGVGDGRVWSSAAAALPGSATETTALVALAYARVRPQAPELEAGVEWLLAHRNAPD